MITTLTLCTRFEVTSSVNWRPSTDGLVLPSGRRWTILGQRLWRSHTPRAQKQWHWRSDGCYSVDTATGCALIVTDLHVIRAACL